MYLVPFLKGEKNDYNNAEAITEAVLCRNLRAVQENNQDQFDLQARHQLSHFLNYTGIDRIH